MISTLFDNYTHINRRFAQIFSKSSAVDLLFVGKGKCFMIKASILFKFQFARDANYSDISIIFKFYFLVKQTW